MLNVEPINGLFYPAVWGRPWFLFYHKWIPMPRDNGCPKRLSMKRNININYSFSKVKNLAGFRSFSSSEEFTSCEFFGTDWTKIPNCTYSEFWSPVRSVRRKFKNQFLHKVCHISTSKFPSNKTLGKMHSFLIQTFRPERCFWEVTWEFSLTCSKEKCTNFFGKYSQFSCLKKTGNVSNPEWLNKRKPEKCSAVRHAAHVSFYYKILTKKCLDF